MPGHLLVAVVADVVSPCPPMFNPSHTGCHFAPPTARDSYEHDTLTRGPFRTLIPRLQRHPAAFDATIDDHGESLVIHGRYSSPWLDRSGSPAIVQALDAFNEPAGEAPGKVPWA